MDITINMTIDEKIFVEGAYDVIATDFTKRRPYLWDWITNFISYIPVSKILMDVGCGGGRVGIECADMSISYIGLDSCQSFVDICVSKDLSAFKCDMCAIPIVDNSVDYITSIASFHHLATYERRLESLCEMRRLLRPGGKVLLSVWSIVQPVKTRRIFSEYGDTMVPWSKPGIEKMRYYYIFKLDELESLFVEAGFAVISHEWKCGNEVYVLE